MESRLYQKCSINVTLSEALDYRVWILEYLDLSQISEQQWRKEKRTRGKKYLAKGRGKDPV